MDAESAQTAIAELDSKELGGIAYLTRPEKSAPSRRRSRSSNLLYPDAAYVAGAALFFSYPIKKHLQEIYLSMSWFYDLALKYSGVFTLAFNSEY